MKTAFKISIVIISWMYTMSLVSEYVLSRPFNAALQIIISLAMLLYTAYSLRYVATQIYKFFTKNN
jgi:hypothetical protein